MNERQAQKRIRTTETILTAAKELIHENGLIACLYEQSPQEPDFLPHLSEYFTGKDDVIDSLCAD